MYWSIYIKKNRNKDRIKINHYSKKVRLSNTVKTNFQNKCIQFIIHVYLFLGVHLCKFRVLHNPCSSQHLVTQQTQNICITFIQRRPNVFDVGPTLHKCYTNVLCLLGMAHYSFRCAIKAKYFTEMFNFINHCLFSWIYLSLLMYLFVPCISPILQPFAKYNHLQTWRSQITV